MDDTEYEDIVSDIRAGKIRGRELRVSEVYDLMMDCNPLAPPKPEGFSDSQLTERGVPMDLACSTNGKSSLYFAKRWVQANVSIRTNSGRLRIVHDQVIGFVPRSTHLLLAGQHLCNLCSFYTIEQ